MKLRETAEVSIFLKAFIPILITILLLEACFIVFFYSFSAKNVKEQLGSKALAIGGIVAILIEDDIDGYKNFIKTLDTTSEYYLRLNTAFSKILKASGERIAYIDTSIRHSDDEIMYVFDGISDETFDFFVAPGLVDSLSEAGKKAYDLQEPFLGDFGTNVDEVYGDLLSAYVPIRDKEGNFVGMVTVQSTKAKYHATLEGLYLFAFVSLAISAIIISLILGYSLGYIQHTFSIDSLTGLHNRSDLMKHLKRDQIQVKKQGLSVVVSWLIWTISNR